MSRRILLCFGVGAVVVIIAAAFRISQRYNAPIYRQPTLHPWYIPAYNYRRRKYGTRLTLVRTVVLNQPHFGVRYCSDRFFDDISMNFVHLSLHVGSLFPRSEPSAAIREQQLPLLEVGP